MTAADAKMFVANTGSAPPAPLASPVPGFPAHATVGFLGRVSARAFELKSRFDSGAPTPSHQQLQELLVPPEPVLLCLFASFTRDKTV